MLDHLWDAKAGLFRDGLDPAGRAVKIHSIHNQTLGILCGLQPRHHERIARDVLAPYLEGQPIPGAQPSSYWVTYVYWAARALGLGRLVAQDIRRRWAPMIPFGGTWETFNNRLGMNSVTHAWSAHPIFHLAGTVGGLTQAAPGWCQVTFQPVLDLAEVNVASVDIPTPLGLIRAGWGREGGAVEAALSLPNGVSADVRLPGVKPGVARGKRSWRVKSKPQRGESLLPGA